MGERRAEVFHSGFGHSHFGLAAAMEDRAAIQQSDQERIFERFYRAERAEHGPTGTGLGLSIVKPIVEAHRGRVWVKSDGGAQHGLFQWITGGKETHLLRLNSIYRKRPLIS